LRIRCFTPSCYLPAGVPLMAMPAYRQAADGSSESTACTPKPEPEAAQTDATGACQARQDGWTLPQLPPNLKVTKQVGKGAYGEVFLCENSVDGSRVAVKWVKDFARDPTFGKRIVREVRILAQLDHPNLLRLADLLPVPGPVFNDVFIAMPFMDLDLHKVIYSRMTLSDGHAQAFACQILRGLKYLHSAEIVHRDLKPSNILVNTDCTLRIADLGLARGRVYEEEKLTDYVVTRWYRAPELILLPSRYFEAVDLWSVGCIQAELLSRKPLFPGTNHIDMLRRFARILGFVPARDLAWIPDEGPAREDVLRFVETLGLPDGESQQPEEPLSERLPKKTDACLDFVKALLTFDPNQRISASAALAHEYVVHLSDPAAETCAPRRFDWNFDCFEPTKANLRDRVYRECARLHPEILARDFPDGQLAIGPTSSTNQLPLGPPPARLPRARAPKVVTAV